MKSTSEVPAILRVPPSGMSSAGTVALGPAAASPPPQADAIRASAATTATTLRAFGFFTGFLLDSGDGHHLLQV
jgi:hypothetical protein